MKTSLIQCLNTLSICILLSISILDHLKVKKAGEWLTSNEVAKILRISTATLHNFKQYGKIPFSQIEGRIMYLTDDIANYLSSQRIKNM